MCVHESGHHLHLPPAEGKCAITNLVSHKTSVCRLGVPSFLVLGVIMIYTLAATYYSCFMSVWNDSGIFQIGPRGSGFSERRVSFSEGEPSPSPSNVLHSKDHHHNLPKSFLILFILPKKLTAHMFASFSSSDNFWAHIPPTDEHPAHLDGPLLW